MPSLESPFSTVDSSNETYLFTVRKDGVRGGAVSVTHRGLIALVALVQQRNVHVLRAVVVGRAVPYVPLQRVLCCQHVVLPKGS